MRWLGNWKSHIFVISTGQKRVTILYQFFWIQIRIGKNSSKSFWIQIIEPSELEKIMKWNGIMRLHVFKFNISRAKLFILNQFLWIQDLRNIVGQICFCESDIKLKLKFNRCFRESEPRCTWLNKSVWKHPLKAYKIPTARFFDTKSRCLFWSHDTLSACRASGLWIKDWTSIVNFDS